MAISFLGNQSVDNSIEFIGGSENYATLKMVSQGLEVSVGDPANTTNPLVHFDGAYERVLIGSTTAANTPYLRIGGAGNQSSRLELAETTTGVGRDMNYGFSFNQTGNVSNKLEIKRHSNSTAGSTVITLARDNNNVVFTGLVSGITPTSAANFVTKAYADGLTPGSGIYLPINNPTFTGTLTGPTANFTSTVTIDNMLTININDIATGENRGLRLINEAGTDQQWNITAGTTGITNDDFCIRDSTNNVNAFRLSEVTGNATFAGKVITTELESASTLLLDAAADITIDAGGGDIILSDDATIFGTISSSGGMQIRSRVNNGDMFLRGVDNGTEFNALTLDMSDAGTGTFNNHIITGGNATFNGGNIALNGAYPRINMYSTDAGEDDWSVINNNGIFGIYNATVASFGLTIAETTNAVSITSGSLILSGTGRIQGVDTVTASTDAANKAYVDSAVAARITPAAPSTISTAIVGETIEISFNQSATSNIDYYQVWSSDDGADYGIIAQIAPSGFSSTMTVVDSSFFTGGTMAYRVYAVREGIYSSPGTTSRAYTVAALAVTNMSVVNLNTAYYIQYEKPITRFLDHVEIYMDSETTQAALNRSGAVLIYSGQNASYMKSVGNSNNFHQFWVEIVTS
jgi:hypothetical protein